MQSLWGKIDKLKVYSLSNFRNESLSQVWGMSNKSLKGLAVSFMVKSAKTYHSPLGSPLSDCGGQITMIQYCTHFYHLKHSSEKGLFWEEVREPSPFLLITWLIMAGEQWMEKGKEDLVYHETVCAEMKPRSCLWPRSLQDLPSSQCPHETQHGFHFFTQCLSKFLQV